MSVGDQNYGLPAAYYGEPITASMVNSVRPSLDDVERMLEERGMVAPKTVMRPCRYCDNHWVVAYCNCPGCGRRWEE